MRALPTARILFAIRNRKWSIHQALAELVDNSFGELRGAASAIWLEWTPKTRELTILDNGRGMDEIADLFTLGKGASSGSGDIGLYGVGGSEALLWLADEVELTTLRDGRVARTRVQWKFCIQSEQFPDINRRWREATVNNCPVDLLECQHGTLIRLGVRKDLRFHPEVIHDRLSRLFGVALRGGRSMTWVTHPVSGPAIETPLHAWDPGPLQDAIRGTVTIENPDGTTLSAAVEAGRVEGLSIANSKLSVNYIYRQVKETTEGFERPMQGLVGNVDLSAEWLPYLTTTKDDIREDGRHLEEALMAAIAVELKALIEQMREARRAVIFTNIRINLKRKFDRGFELLAEETTRGQGEPGEESPAPGPDPGPSKPPRPKPSGRAAEINIQHATDDALGGLLCKVEVSKTSAEAYINIEHPQVRKALEDEPVNRLLLEQILISALAAQIVKANALVTFGLFTQRDADALVERYDGNALDVLLHLIRVLTDGIADAA